MPRVQISVPLPNEVVVAGKPFRVAGVVFTRGMPEPISIDSVTVQVANDPPIDATLKSNPPQLNTVDYSAQATVNAPVTASRLLTVKATDENGISGRAFVTVFVGQGPLDAVFTGIATLRTTFSRAPGPFVESVSIGLQFSADRKTLTVTSFPTLVSSKSVSGITVTITVTQTPGGGVGTFDPATGAITLPITLSFQVTASVGPITLHNGKSLLPLVLSTGRETSPSGAFTDTGSPLAANGSVTVVGDGTFSGDLLGGSDASLVLSGTVSPHP